MLRERLELSIPFGNQLLRLACIPIPPPQQGRPSKIALSLLFGRKNPQRNSHYACGFSVLQSGGYHDFRGAQGI